MQVNESIANKSDGPSETEQYVCSACERAVTGHSIKDGAGNAASLYRCPSCGPRTRTDLTRKWGEV